MSRHSFRQLLGVMVSLTVLMPSFARDHADPPGFTLYDPGTEAIVDYKKYGVFENKGTPDYLYRQTDREGLAKALGEGIYPNTSLFSDPGYRKALKANNLQGSVWDHFVTPDVQDNFYIWASSHENPGTRQYYVSLLLKRAGLTLQAVKSFYACVVQFPKTMDMTYWKTAWYPAVTALDQVRFLLRTHPELGMVLADARIRIENKYEDGVSNKRFYVDPGKMMPATPEQIHPRRFDVTAMPLRRQLGKGLVTLRQYENGHWMLFVRNAPYVVRGIIYQPSPVGKTPDDESLTAYRDWMISDLNHNGKPDGPYDAWVDKNGNNRQDPDEPSVGDFQLLKEMGVNTIRLYHHGYNKALLRDLYQTYGIRIIMGDYAGMYAIGSGATWEAGTDYTDLQQQANMLHSIQEMVEEYKGEPYILFWVLGNENNFGVANNSRKNSDAYYAFINRAAQLIKSLDPDHPVAICNGDLGYLNKIRRFCPDADILGVNAYRGDHGFGDSFWQDAAELFDRPVVLTEFGCPAYNRFASLQTSEAQQSSYLKANWQDIEWNLGGGPGVGNALGGVIFEWLDEWWKAGPPPKFDPSVHDTSGQFGGPFPDGWSHEEWYGIAGQGSGQHSPFERQLRQAYFMFKQELWNRKKMRSRGLPPDPEIEMISKS